MECDECRGHIKIQHPDDKPINAFRVLIQKLDIDREEAKKILDKVNTELVAGEKEMYPYLEDKGEKLV